MKITVKERLLACLIVLIIAVATLAMGGGDDDPSSGAENFGGGYSHLEKTMPEGALIAASSAVGAKAHHRHMVRPGLTTTYALRLINTEKNSITINLKLGSVPVGWNAKPAETSVKLNSGKMRYVMFELRPSSDLPTGSVASVTVTATTSSGKSGKITLEAETTDKHKIYMVSIDSLGTEYLKLNAKGNGWGKQGDWLMPNLHSFIKKSTYYPNHKVHLVSATDMNHAVYLSGAYPGRLGMYSVNVFFFGFDAKGKPIIKGTPADLMYWGPDGKPVTNMFNVVKDPKYGGNASAFTAYSSGKGWVPEHYRNPVMGLDRIATSFDYPDYVAPPPHPPTKGELVGPFVTIHFKKLGDPDLFVWEDIYTIDQTIEVINNEDPDVFYILLGGVDMAGHAYGAGYNFDEWDDRGTPDDLSDDKSKINDNANRLGIIKTVKGADEQLGRFIEYLKKRGTYEKSYIIVQSDHNMETNFFDGPNVNKILKKTGYSPKKDYYMFTASQVGALFLRRKDPGIIPALEKALEEYRIKNPLTGALECPMLVMTRKEMRTGIDEATGRQVTLPMELYSRYYIEHPKPDGLKWPDMLILAKRYYQFPVTGIGLANVGAGLLPFQVPPFNIFVGGHGGMSTQPSLLALRGPFAPEGVTSGEQTWPADVAPTLYRLEGYKIPECVQGKGLPKIDPTMR